MDTKVTIIVPIYNTKKYLKKCIESIMYQTYQNFELICIDDCSTDGSLELLYFLQNQYRNKIKIICNTKNIGQGKCRMQGIASAEGEYIFFVDSDDYIKKDYIYNYIMQADDNDVVVGGFIQVKNNKLIYRYVDDDLRSIISYSHACCKMYKKSFIQKNKIDFSNYRKGEDIYFSLLLILYKAKHKFINYAGYYYFVNNMSTTQTITHSTDFEKVISNIFSRIMQMDAYKCAEIYIKQYIEYAYIAGMINALVTYSHGCTWLIMKQKYDFFCFDLKKKYSNYRKDRFLYRWNKQGASLRCRIGVYCTMNSMKFHVSKLLYWFISIVK